MRRAHPVPLPAFCRRALSSPGGIDIRPADAKQRRIPDDVRFALAFRFPLVDHLVNILCRIHFLFFLLFQGILSGIMISASPISAITQIETRTMIVTVIRSILPICVVMVPFFFVQPYGHYHDTEADADHQADDQRDHRGHRITSTKGKAARIMP
jgi:hypothetical protein